MAVGFKRCTRCHVVKAFDAFNRHRGGKDGLQSRCRPCQVAANRASRLRHPTSVRKWKHDRQERLREEESERRRKWKEANPEKRHAHKELQNAVRGGRVTKPAECQRCGQSKPFRIEGHHENYDRPLDVVWLCSPCHAQRHLELAAA